MVVEHPHCRSELRHDIDTNVVEAEAAVVEGQHWPECHAVKAGAHIAITNLDVNRRDSAEGNEGTPLELH